MDELKPIISTAPTFTRPSDTTQYAALDLVANSTAAASVVPLAFLWPRGPGYRLNRVFIEKSANSITSATFLLHLFTVIPTFATNGDNSAVSGNTTATGYIGTFTVSGMAGLAASAVGQGVPTVGNEILWTPTTAADAQDRVTLYGILVSAGTYTPASAETFSVSLLAELTNG